MAAPRRVLASAVTEELEALTQCHNYISDLDDEGQGRVLRWLGERLEQERIDREDEKNQAVTDAIALERLAVQAQPEEPF